ncbi:MAG: energy transducer TonB family protein [Hyphomicrobium sp.]
MDAVRSTTWLISLGLHAGILVAVLGVTAGGVALESGTGDDVFVVEQGIALEGVAKLGEAEELIETIDIPPVQQAQLKPPEEIEPDLTEVITSTESEHEDAVIDREPEPILEEQEELPVAVPVDQQLPQVATLIEKSSSEAQTGGDTTQRRVYIGLLFKTIVRNQVKPRRRQAGTVLIIFTVDPSGQLLSRKVKKSSGSKMLDDAAIAALDRAAPFPPMPENIAQGPLELQIPFKFVTR